MCFLLFKNRYKIKFILILILSFQYIKYHILLSLRYLIQGKIQNWDMYSNPIFVLLLVPKKINKNNINLELTNYKKVLKLKKKKKKKFQVLVQ